ncbi:MAG: hypothetical protein IJA60_07615 [Clostridia bacterium]|nr:hypothetical protein [Clostridia bacterium]
MSVGIIGAADGPTAILVSSTANPWLIGAISLLAVGIVGIIIAVIIKNK